MTDDGQASRSGGAAGASRPRVYLAGPEVFFPDGRELLARKSDLCRRYGFEPNPPGDFSAVGDPRRLGAAISEHNEVLIAGSDLCIANLTPFRGVSADVGTVFEVGYAMGLGIPVFGYTDDPRDYAERVREQAEATAITVPDGELVEDHGFADNLMIDGGLSRRTADVVRPVDGATTSSRDLATFERCLRAARDHLHREPSRRTPVPGTIA